MRYGLRRQLVLNLGMVMVLSSLLLSFFAMHMAQLRFSRDRARYLRTVSEQLDQIVLLTVSLESQTGTEKPFWIPSTRLDGSLWPTDAAFVFARGKIRPLMGLPPTDLRLRVQMLQRRETADQSIPLPSAIKPVKSGKPRQPVLPPATSPSTRKIAPPPGRMTLPIQPPQTPTPQLPKPGLVQGFGLPTRNNVSWIRRKLNNRVVWERYRHLYQGETRLGTLWLRWDISALRNEFYSYQGLLFLYLMLFCLLILVVVMLFLEGRMVRPINRLGNAIRELSEGDMVTSLHQEVDRRDQIGDLARTFLTMRDILQSQAHERENHIQELESANLALERAQQELVQREKLATLGSLSAGVAHEVGNPLSAIMGYSDLLKGSPDISEMDRDLAARIHKETQRIDRIIRDLLDYARPVSQDKPGDPVSSIREALELLRLQKRFRQMQVDTAWHNPLPLVRLPESYLIQVLINLLLNAADACDGEGHIDIRVFPVDQFVVFEVADDGPGVPEDLRKQLFEPFFTTKDPGKGVGLGLALCRRLVTEAGGRIDVGEAPEGGACFTIALPFADGTVLDDVEEETVEPRMEHQSVTITGDEWQVVGTLNPADLEALNISPRGKSKSSPPERAKSSPPEKGH